MRRPGERLLVIGVLLLFCAGGAAEPAADEASERAAENRWFFLWGPSNLRPRLKPSEKQIDRELNSTLGAVIPGWKNPITFADWRDDFKLWDFHAGFGRDISPRLSWFLAVGGSAGTVHNRERYWLAALPLKTDIDFTRKVWCAGGGLSWYPWGKPAWCAGRGKYVGKVVRGIRPFLEAALYYGHVTAKASAKLRVRRVATLVHIKEQMNYDMVYGSPRVGIEAPLGKRDSLAIEAGYGMFSPGSDEFNGLNVYFYHRHKF